MGVSWIVNIPFEENRSTQQLLEGLGQRLLALGAEKDGMHYIDCDVYFSAVPQAAHTCCHLMHNSEYPVTTFAILDTSTCLTADNIIDLIMLKLKPFYDTRKQKVECKGSRFTLQDFVFKAGAVYIAHTNSVLGVLLEVEYLPSVAASNCFGLMKEMVQGIVGKAVEIPNYLKLHANNMYTPNDTMQQYLEQFNLLKKVQAQSQGHTQQS